MKQKYIFHIIFVYFLFSFSQMKEGLVKIQFWHTGMH